MEFKKLQTSMAIPALRRKIENSQLPGALSQILNQIPTQGNNPWIDGVSYDAKLINPYTNLFSSINHNPAKESIVNLGIDFGVLNVDPNSEKPVEISISFISDPALPGALQQSQSTGNVIPWPDNLKSAYLEAFKSWQDIANIDITEKREGENVNIEYYLLDITNPDIPSAVLGAHDGILDTPEGLPQTSWINANQYNNTTTTKPGSDFLETAVHEIGHGLGLSHPHDAGLDADTPSPVFPGLNPFLGFGDRFGSLGYGLYGANQGVFSIMSYNRGLRFDAINQPLQDPRGSERGGHIATPMALDVLATQIKYGYNTSTALEDNTYELPSSASEFSYWKSIWDCGGNDTIDARTALRGTSIELRAAPMNAYRPQSKAMSEQYNWEALGIKDSNHANTLQTIIDLINPTGSLLGTTYQFAILSSQLVDDEIFIPFNQELNESSLPFSEWVNEKLSATTFLTFGPELEKITKTLAEISDLLSQTDPAHAELKRQTYIDQQALLQESAANVGGYISQELGHQGGFTITAGTTIENALGSDHDDIITGNHVGNVLNGYSGNDQLSGRQGDDTINGGLGDDRIDGGTGADQLYGGEGSNTFLNCKDGFTDTLHINANQNRNPNSTTSTVDIIANLDAIDRIILTDADFTEVRIEAASLNNQFGIGIYSGNRLEAIYLGGELSVEDIQRITTIS